MNGLKFGAIFFTDGVDEMMTNMVGKCLVLLNRVVDIF